MQRPTSVTVFGILNIVFAVFGIFGVIGSLILFLPQMADSHNPVVQLIHDSPVYAMWLKFSLVLGLGAVAVLLAAGIGLLKLKSWARQLSIGYAIYAALMVIVGTVVNFFLLVRPLLEQAKQQHGPEAVGAIAGAIGGTVGGCLGLIYPVFLLVFMLRANVAAAFRPAETPPPAGQP